MCALIPFKEGVGSDCEEIDGVSLRQAAVIAPIRIQFLWTLWGYFHWIISFLMSFLLPLASGKGEMFVLIQQFVTWLSSGQRHITGLPLSVQSTKQISDDITTLVICILSHWEIPLVGILCNSMLPI